MKLKKIWELILTGVLSVLLINKGHATLISAISDDTLNAISNVMNSKKFDAKNIITEFSKFDKKKAREIEAYLTAHPEFKNLEIPKTKVEKHGVSFKIQDHKFYFLPQKNGNVAVIWRARKIQLDYSMTVVQMAKTLSEALENQKKISFMSFFIPEADAQTKLLLTGAALAVIGTFLQFLSTIPKLNAQELETKIHKLNMDCIEVENETLGDKTVVLTKYEMIKDIKARYCIEGVEERPLGDFSKSCKDLVRLQVCFKNKVDQLNNSSRANVKEMSPSSAGQSGNAHKK